MLSKVDDITDKLFRSDCITLAVGLVAKFRFFKFGTKDAKYVEQRRFKTIEIQNIIEVIKKG